MSSNHDTELDALRQQRRAQLEQEIQQQVLEREEQEQKHQQQVQAQENIDSFIRANLSSEAKTRLTQLSLANAQNGEQIKLLLIKNIQNGNMSTPVSDEQFRMFLESLSKSRRNTSIRRI